MVPMHFIEYLRNVSSLIICINFIII